MDLGLKDKRAFIAGSSRGLGYATALLLATEDCNVVLNSRDDEKVKVAAETVNHDNALSVRGLARHLSGGSIAEGQIRSAEAVQGRANPATVNPGGAAA